jgi:hypothetical protein
MQTNEATANCTAGYHRTKHFSGNADIGINGQGTVIAANPKIVGNFKICTQTKLIIYIFTRY